MESTLYGIFRTRWFCIRNLARALKSRTCLKITHMPWNLAHALKSRTCLEISHVPWNLARALKSRTCLEISYSDLKISTIFLETDPLPSWIPELIKEKLLDEFTLKKDNMQRLDWMLISIGLIIDHYYWRRRARVLVRRRMPWIEQDGEWELERLLLAYGDKPGSKLDWLIDWHCFTIERTCLCFCNWYLNWATHLFPSIVLHK